MGLPFASRKSARLMVGLYGALHRSAAPAIGAVPISEATATTTRGWFMSTDHGRCWFLGISDSSLRAGLSRCGPLTHGQVGDSRAPEFLPRLSLPRATKLARGARSAGFLIEADHVSTGVPESRRHFGCVHADRLHQLTSPGKDGFDGLLDAVDHDVEKQSR